jgi:hypothetical protein
MPMAGTGSEGIDDEQPDVGSGCICGAPVPGFFSFVACFIRCEKVELHSE